MGKQERVKKYMWTKECSELFSNGQEWNLSSFPSFEFPPSINTAIFVFLLFHPHHPFLLQHKMKKGENYLSLFFFLPLHLGARASKVVSQVLLRTTLFAVQSQLESVLIWIHTSPIYSLGQWRTWSAIILEWNTMMAVSWLFFISFIIMRREKFAHVAFSPGSPYFPFDKSAICNDNSFIQKIVNYTIICNFWFTMNLFFAKIEGQ